MDVGGEVRLGSMLFTLVEPHAGQAVAYNRWYERDHFYAGCLVGPWLFAGRRWVATRDLKDRRFPLDPPMFGDPRLGSYLATYWVLDGKHDEHFEWALRQVRWLHEHGRMFAARDHVHTLLYRYAWAAGDGDGVPPELALDHPFPGLLVTMVDRDPGVTTADLEEWARRHRDEGSGTLTLGFDPVPLAADAPVAQPSAGELDRRTLLLSFVETAPDKAWPHHQASVAALEAARLGRGTWCSPFIPTVPGTDRYADQL